MTTWLNRGTLKMKWRSILRSHIWNFILPLGPQIPSHTCTLKYIYTNFLCLIQKLFTVYQPFWSYLQPKLFWIVWYFGGEIITFWHVLLFNRCLGEEEVGSYFPRGYLHASEFDEPTGIRTRPPRFLITSLYPLHHPHIHQMQILFVNYTWILYTLCRWNEESS